MSERSHSFKVMLALTTIYMVWGSSFVITKIAVGTLPPTLLSGVRFTSAGVLLALIARYLKRSAWPARAIEWRHVAVAGFFMIFTSNGLNSWAVKFLPSNQAALLNSTSALWIAGLGVFGRRGHPLTRTAIVGISLGFAGAALTLIPKGHLSSDSLLAQIGILVGCFGWGLGTLYYRSIDTALGSLMFMGLQMCLGGMMQLGLGLLHGDLARWHPDTTSLISLAYLTLISSCIAYTAYGWLSLNAPPALIGSYGYVNPAVAAYLGWQFLDEHLSALQIVGMLVIIAGVCMLTVPGGSLTDRKTLEEPKTP